MYYHEFIVGRFCSYYSFKTKPKTCKNLDRRIYASELQASSDFFLGLAAQKIRRDHKRRRGRIVGT